MPLPNYFYDAILTAVPASSLVHGTTQICHKCDYKSKTLKLTMDFESPASPSKKSLPIGLRFVWAMLLPNVLLYATIGILWANLKLPQPTPPDAGAFPVHVFVVGILIGMALICFGFPIFIFTAAMTFVPWRTWYLALLGGFGGVAAGVLTGVATVLVLRLLSG